MPDLASHLLTEVQTFVAATLASPQQMAANGAAVVGIGFVLAGALTRTMLPLRCLAVGSNIGMLLYGALHPSPITLITAALLLPINLYRMIEVLRLTRRVARAVVQADMAAVWLRPYMKKRRLKAGEILFSKGDEADKLYLLAAGELELTGLGIRLKPGRIFGEIALFTPEGVRTQTIRCVGPCTVLEIGAGTVRQIFFQNPAFAFHLVGLLAERLASDVVRAEGAMSRDDVRT